MKIVVVGDIHGRTIWQDIVKTEKEFDLLIFIGDYFDSREDIEPEEQKSNFKKILTFKKRNRDKVILLLGNHDYHYLEGVSQRYSGYQTWQKTDIGILLKEALKSDLIKMCHVEDRYLFTHAGVTNTWCKGNLPDNSLDGLSLKLEHQINQIFKYRQSYFGFVHSSDIYGDDPRQSPIWVRPNSLIRDKIDGFIQVVGHTMQTSLELDESCVVLIDTLGTSKEYLVIEDQELIVKKIGNRDGRR